MVGMLRFAHPAVLHFLPYGMRRAAEVAAAPARKIAVAETRLAWPHLMR